MRQSCVVTGDGSRAVVLVVDGDVEVVLWRFSPRARPDLGVVDTLARLQVAAHRCGWSIRLRNPCPELCGLLELVGLADALLLESVGKSERDEQLRVQEVVQTGDLPP